VPRDVVALVSADDFVSAVRVFADRANDLLRRSGVAPLEAIELCEKHTLGLLEAVATEPETVIDLAGWWFARVIELVNGREPADSAAPEDAISMLAGTPREARVRAALSALPEPEREAVVLRDCYDLPPQAVGVALHTDTDSAAELTAIGRLQLVATYDDRPAPDLSGHSGRTTVDLIALSRLAEGSLEAPRAAPLRRHLGNCAACDDVLEALAKARRLAAGLPIIAMDDQARESLIDRVATRATSTLPSHEAVLRAVDEDHDPGPAISPVVAVVVLVLALALGIAIAVLSHSSHPSTRLPTVTTSTSAPPSASPPATSAPSLPTTSNSPAHASTPSKKASSKTSRNHKASRSRKTKHAKH
jgi:DNA-directed RNA polymerase specialized sigma24 family protein